MKRKCAIRCAWSRRAISLCRGLLWKACIILPSALVALLAGSWFVLDWTDEGADAYPGGIVLRDSAGDILRVSLGPGDVDCRPCYEADPDDWIVKAIVASEDSTFWTHGGVRPLSILRAACQNAFYGRRISGASTITMQTVRLIRPHPKTLWWKYKEAILAMKMERVRDKRWILSQYLNRAPYGSNFVGIEAASSGWFGKRAKQLGLAEAAMLAGMVQAPSRFRPDRGLAAALRRRDYVLGRMLDTGVITHEQYEGAKSVTPVVRRAPRPFKCPYFCDWVLTCMGKDRAAQRQSGDYVTTLDADIQSAVQHAIDEASVQGGYSAAAVVLRVDSGAVVALACSGDYFDPDAGQVNTALAPRPAGSTLKPFLTALAMDAGYVAPDEMLVDAPTSFEGYRPANFDASYRGLVSVRDALVLSLNIPFVRLLSRVGVERFGANLRKLGFEHMDAPDQKFGLGMAIGNVEVTLVELVGAYGTLARDGVYRPPVALMDASDGEYATHGDRVYSADASYRISDMLSGDERSSAALGHVADVRTSRFAWKTGTSSAYRDAWTIVWNPQYVVGVWCGHKSGGFGDKTVVGAKAAAPVAWTIARALYPQDDGPWFPRVQNVQGSKTSNPNPVSPLSIIKPEPNAQFIVVPGMLQQKIVCRTVGNPEGAPLWWFVDGRHLGTTRGNDPFVAELEVGQHTIVCASADDASAEVAITVRRSEP